MEIVLEKKEAALYERLHVSSLDLGFASYCLGVILKKGWHWHPWEKRGSIYEQQTAFTSACVMAYARPFTHSRGGWPLFPLEIVSLDADEHHLHKAMMEMRNTIFAHSDGKHYQVKPWRAGKFSTDIVSAAWPRLSKDEALLLQGVIEKLLRASSQKQKQIRSE